MCNSPRPSHYFPGVLRKYYLPSSLLSLAADDASFRGLYQEMLLTLEPMIYLPFDLSIDFELRQATSPAGVAAAGGPGAAETRLSVSSAVGEQPASPQVMAGNRPCTYHAQHA